MATTFRWNNAWLLFLLPLAGVSITLLYRFKGKNAEAGNNLVMDEIHKQGGGIPTRMAPFMLITTVVTHLFGGSAWREGTAIQIGGSMASFMAYYFSGGSGIYASQRKLVSKGDFKEQVIDQELNNQKASG